jgi:hypothetical protein
MSCRDILFLTGGGTASALLTDTSEGFQESIFKY